MNWPYDALISAAAIFASGVAVGSLIRPRKASRLPSRLVKAIHPILSVSAGNISNTSWTAEIHCPACGKQKIDPAEEKPRLLHRCEKCNLNWAPFPVATRGVES